MCPHWCGSSNNFPNAAGLLGGHGWQNKFPGNESTIGRTILSEHRPASKISEMVKSKLDLLAKRQSLTDSLFELPYDLILYLERATVYFDLNYPDLAAGDAYRCLMLTDEVRNEGFEYHESAMESLQAHTSHRLEILRDVGERDILQGVTDLDVDAENAAAQRLAMRASIRSFQILASSLMLCGCLQSALDFCNRGLTASPADEELRETQRSITAAARRRLKTEDIDINDLPSQGLARREIYPWNDHEPDRFDASNLAFLNAEMSKVAPKCEVRVTELPTLLEFASSGEGAMRTTNKQLGVFATADIAPGEVVLNEFSILTANSRLKENLCDACSSELPSLADAADVMTCEECVDIMFCNRECYDRAMETYHPAFCDKDIDTIAKDPDPKESPNALYLLLLARALAMSATQGIDALDLKEVKYIWGDFIPSAVNDTKVSSESGPPPAWTLPFSFASNILGPLHILEKMDIDIFAELPRYDLWIFNTLYSKFRGTASARVSLRDGRPEVAAVHPLWCLANHDCDPNVWWEWGGMMTFTARERRVVDGKLPGIRKGEEVLNHYCDIELPVADRREWAMGSLGGRCMCRRCRDEAGEVDD